MKIIVHTIDSATTAEGEVLREKARDLLRHYAGDTGLDVCLQDFEAEVTALPGTYSAPRGCFFYAEAGGEPAGCVGVRPAPGERSDVCELKRLFVVPRHRSKGVARLLLFEAIRAARDFGFRQIELDTLPSMRMAIKLYREIGFSDCAGAGATDNRHYLVLELDNWSEERVNRENLFHLFDFNRKWSQQMRDAEPGFFSKLSHLQTPEYLWIGCSDSRVPANQIVGLLPGEIFVHRNIANVVVHTDLNCFSVIQFAVDVLNVKHIMVVGHYGCGGVKAALNGTRVGLADLWLRHVQDVRVKHSAQVDSVAPEHRQDRLCELNVIEQVRNVCYSMVVQDAWARDQDLTVHGWIYGLHDGLMRDLGLTVTKLCDVEERYEMAVAALL